MYTMQTGFREPRRARIIGRLLDPRRFCVMTKLSLSTLFSIVLASSAGCEVGDVMFEDGGQVDGDVPAAGSGGGAGAAGGPTPGMDGGLDVDSGAAGSSGAGTGGGAGTDPDVAMLADELASATCSALRECVGGADLLADLLGGRDCAEVTAADLRNGELAGLPAASEAERILFDADELASCAADIAALGCDVRSRRLPASCELTLLGTVELAGECAIDQECAGDAFCALGDSCPGQCTAQLAEDAQCADGDDDQCTDGLVCAAATDTCAPLGENADDCGAGLPPCAPGLVCFDGGAGAACTTVAALYFRQLNETCLPGDGTCAAGVSACGDVELCEPGLVCESAESGGVCKPPTGVRGGECKRAVPNQCRLEQVCDAAAPGQVGQCVDRPGSGEPCIARSPRCAPDHVCVEDTCLELLDNGEGCRFHEECRSRVCGGGVCESSAICVE
jgi:hypothetical protein